MLLVFASNNLISPRPSELTPGQLLIDISCHVISPRFTFAYSSCLIYPPSLPPSLPLSLLPPYLIGSLNESPDPLSLLVINMPKTDSLAFGLCVKMLGKGHQGIVLWKDNPFF